MRITIVDVETTGLAPPDHAPCEIGWVELDTVDGGFAIGGGGTTLCHPGRPIPPEASAVHHIIDADLGPDAPSWRVAMHMPLDGAPDVLCAHNCRFERQWLTEEVTGGLPWICTYRCALRLWPEAPAHSNGTLRYWLQPAGLDRARAGLAHRAWPDAYVTAHLLRDMLAYAPVDRLIAWSAEPALLPRVGFGKYRGAPWSAITDPSYLHWLLGKGEEFDEDTRFTARHYLAMLPEGS